LPLLADEQYEVRYLVALALAEIGEPAVPPLMKLIRSPVEAVQQNAASVLVRVGGPSVDSLILLLQEKDKVLRRLAVWALGEISDVRAIEPMIGLMKDWDPGVRTAAINTLTRMWGPVVDPLLELLKDWSAQVRISAVEALGRMRDRRAIVPIAGMLSHKEPDVREAAAEALSSIGGDGVAKALIEPLSQGRIETRTAACDVFKRLGESAVPTLATILRQGTESKLRATVARILGEMGHRSSIKALLSALNDEDTDVRLAVSSALTLMNWRPGSEAQRARFAVAAQKWDDAVTVGAEGTDALLFALNDVHRQVRLDAVRSLGRLGVSRAIDHLVYLLDDHFPDIAQAAAEALGKIGQPRSVEGLVLALQREDVRHAAIDALGQIGDPSAVMPLVGVLKGRDPATRRKAMEALSMIGRDAVEALTATLRTADNEVRKLAAEVLGRLEDPRAVDPLKQAMKDKDETVRQAADDALARILKAS
jgi:HEAT repeat protein